MRSILFGIVGAASWEKCTAPCDGGHQFNSNDKRQCNVESCAIYDEDLLLDSRMESDLSSSPWVCNGGCHLHDFRNAYDNHGFVVTNRNGAHSTVMQEQSCSKFKHYNGEELVAKAYFQFDGPNNAFDVIPRIRVDGDGIDTKNVVLFHASIAPSNGSGSSWLEVSGAGLFKVTEWDDMDDTAIDQMRCTLIFNVEHPDIDYAIDHAYLLAKSKAKNFLESTDGFLLHGGFEAAVNSGSWHIAGWHADSKAVTVTAADAPEGFRLRVVYIINIHTPT